MNRRDTLVVLLALGTMPFAALAQQPRKLPKIGFLFFSTFARHPNVDAFFQELMALGYIEGQNITIERREAEGRTERLPQLAQELVALHPDVIVANTSPAAAAMQKATQSTPIIMINVGDPVGSGFAKSLAHPGGNMTGASNNTIEVTRKRIQLLKEVVPSASRVAVLWNSQIATSAVMAKETERGALALGLQIESLEFKGPEGLQAVLMKTVRAQGLIVITDSFLTQELPSIIRFAAANRLAAFGTFPEEARNGALAAYGPSPRAVFLRGAVYVDKILRGAKPADLPIEEPTKYELVINLKTAKALGLTIPQSVLIRADEVIR